MATDVKKLLARSWIFNDLSSGELDGLVLLTSARGYAAKATIVRKGDTCTRLFAVLRGRLKVVTPGIDANAAFNIIGPGEVFGEIAALDGQRRSATVKALEPCQLAIIDHRDFSAFLDKHPEVSRKLLAVLARRVRLLSERVEDRAFLDTGGRLAKCVLGLADRYGRKKGDDVRVELRLSQRDLGELVDASRESVNKLLRAWQRDGTVTHTADAIIVHDRDQLVERVRTSS